LPGLQGIGLAEGLQRLRQPALAVQRAAELVVGLLWVGGLAESL